MFLSNIKDHVGKFSNKEQRSGQLNCPGIRRKIMVPDGIRRNYLEEGIAATNDGAKKRGRERKSQKLPKIIQKIFIFVNN